MDRSVAWIQHYFDLGLFVGQCLIVRSPHLNWIYVPGVSDDGSANHSGYGIDGFKSIGNRFDPMQFMYSECANDEVDIRVGQPGRRVKVNGLVGKVRDFAAR